jgi:hypothetical protein
MLRRAEYKNGKYVIEIYDEQTFYKCKGEYNKLNIYWVRKAN